MCTSGQHTRIRRGRLSQSRKQRLGIQQQRLNLPALGGAEAAVSVQTASPSLIRPVINTAMPASDPLIGNIWQHTMGSSPFHQQFNAQSQLDSLYQYASLTQAELNMEAGNLTAQIDVAINARMSTINASIDAAIGQVQGQFSGAKERAAADVAGVRARCDGQ